jgi:hypothetical protein
LEGQPDTPSKPQTKQILIPRSFSDKVIAYFYFDCCAGIKGMFIFG